MRKAKKKDGSKGGENERSRGKKRNMKGKWK